MKILKTTLFAMAVVMCGGVQAQGLKDAYKDYFSVGVAVNMGNMNNEKHIDIIKTNYNSVTAENDMKPGSVQPNEGEWNWRNADAIANFCRENGIKLRGHCLVWHSQVGRWMFQDVDASGNSVQAAARRNSMRG
ncbi:MAG: endo-1,4-beta-xylanase [Bacteroidales bacterium]|nr:endo-1,4-beta-xylanase [Bacteroidales bacterium]